jgi:UDP-glucose:(heptosyl)LPS alpha-1,3-glucosyltransferase
VKLAFLLYKYFPYGGMQRDFRRFVEEALMLGHECRVYYIDWQGEQLAGIDLRRVPARAVSNHTRNERYYQWVQQDLAADPVDAVVGFNKMPGLDIYYAADSCYLDKALRERNWLYRCGSRFRHFVAYEEAVFGANSDTEILLISQTEQIKFEHRYQTDKSRLHMLPPGVSRDRAVVADTPPRRQRLRDELGIGGKDFAMLFIGSGFIKKGLDRAIIALAQLQQERADVTSRLFVVGQDKALRYKRLARRLGVADDVVFLGGRDDIPDLLFAADALVHPALDEAAGIVLLEALVAGLPVVVTDVCGYSTHIAAAAAGVVLSSPFSQNSLNKAVSHMLDGYFRGQCRERGLEYASRVDLYSMHKTGAALIAQFASARLEQSR